MSAVIAPKAFASRRERSPSLAEFIDALLEHADLRQDLGAGRALVRLSAAALARLRRISALGDSVGRLADLAVVWDEREDVLVRVLDGAPQDLPPPAPEDRFELTEAGLEYLARRGAA
ncbi:MAG TPA: hypothetical protein VGS12_00065 [Caulobacteraceae bacterium]|nr:hypothetical protein [Caulobacteraceae bacterium]